MKLEDLGFTLELENYRRENNRDSFEVARVISEHKGRYVVRTILKEYEAEVIGNLRFTAEKRSDFPAVGDWVAISEYDEEKVLIHQIYPRKSIIERQAVGKDGEKQIIATNIDYAFIVLSVDRDFNLNRLERYLTLCYDAKVEPLIVLNKIDLTQKDELIRLMETLKGRVASVPIFAISNETLQGVAELKSRIIKGKTYCLLGSSGVGKSTLLNNLTSGSLMKTDSISVSTNKGRHTTSAS